MIEISAFFLGNLLSQNLDPVTRRQIAISEAMLDRRVPSDKALDNLEAILSKDTSVGNVSKWSRRYSFGLNKEMALSPDKIRFSLRKSNKYIGTRKSLTYRMFAELDDSQFYRVDGYYNVQSRELKITYRGPNKGI